ncbi:MAG TPA: rRNA maturation RNase YbeY [Bacteroidota bacterium]|nr:rRNA maturation RNase YbeY [Bacteroidota bacterium]
MVEVINHHPRYRFSKTETQRTVQAVLRKERKKLSSLSVVFVGHRVMRKINRLFLGHDYSTDVISFPLMDGMGFDAELYINLDRAKSQAKQYKVPYSHEVRRLLIHGTLHLLGYDDRTEKQRKQMQRREDFYLTRLTQKRI